MIVVHVHAATVRLRYGLLLCLGSHELMAKWINGTFSKDCSNAELAYQLFLRRKESVLS